MLLVLITFSTCGYFDPSAAAGAKPSFFWIDSDWRIFRAPLEDPGNFHEIVGSPGMPTCLKVDPLGGFIYWGVQDMEMNHSIHRANLDGDMQELFINTDDYVKSIAIDPLEKMIYYTEGHSIRKAPLNKEDPPEPFFDQPDFLEITDITLDFTENRLIYVVNDMYYYWIDLYEPGYDNEQQLQNNAEKIIIDNFHEFVYYLYLEVAPNGGIYRENFDGGSVRQVFFSDMIVDFAVDIQKDFLYCAEFDSVYRIPAEGGSAEMIPDISDIILFTIDFIQ